MFTPPGQDPTAVRTILIVFVLAMLASMCSRQMAHGAERFLPEAQTAVTLSLRGDASVTGDEIRLRQIARWAETDKPTLDPIGDLVIARFGQGKAFRNLALDEVKNLLRDAGVNLATIDFVGPIACRIDRSDATFAPGKALEQATAVSQPTAAAPAVAAETPDAASHTLRQILTENLAEKLKLPVEDLQITFKPGDEALLRRAEPQDSFDVHPQRAGNLGDVSWGVTISGQTRAFITAHARAWRQQVTAVHPLSVRQIITAEDVADRRTLVDNLPPDALLSLDHVVGQASTREIAAGAVFSGRMVEPARMVKMGQDVTIDSTSGGVRLLSAAKAMSDGTMGQTVRLRNEQTRQVFNGIVTGPKRVSLGAIPTSVSMAGSVR